MKKTMKKKRPTLHERYAYYISNEDNPGSKYLEACHIDCESCEHYATCVISDQQSEWFIAGDFTKRNQIRYSRRTKALEILQKENIELLMEVLL